MLLSYPTATATATAATSTMACKSQSLYSLMTRISGKPRSLFNSTSAAIALNQPLHQSPHFPHSLSLISSPNGRGVKVLLRYYCSPFSIPIPIPKMGSHIVRVFALSNNGGGSAGGSAGGGSGGGNSGDSGPGGGNSGDSGPGGGNNWSLLSWYLSLLEKYPVLTKAVTSALLTLVGDVICQVVIDKATSLDWKRTFLFTSLGLALVGPTLHYWYFYLSKLVTVSGSSGALARLLLDQMLFSPIFIGVFLSTLVTLEGKPHQVIPKLKQEWFSAVLANWQLWIPFQFLNFRFVPQQFQVLAANFIALIWNVILSYKAHKEVVVK